MALILHGIGDVYQTVKQYQHLTTPLNATNVVYPDNFFYLHGDKVIISNFYSNHQDVININQFILEHDTYPPLYYFIIALPFFIFGWALIVTLWLSELQLR
jgi:hypothetical protein